MLLGTRTLCPFAFPSILYPVSLTSWQEDGAESRASQLGTGWALQELEDLKQVADIIGGLMLY